MRGDCICAGGMVEGDWVEVMKLIDEQLFIVVPDVTLGRLSISE